MTLTILVIARWDRRRCQLAYLPLTKGGCSAQPAAYHPGTRYRSST